MDSLLGRIEKGLYLTNGQYLVKILRDVDVIVKEGLIEAKIECVPDDLCEMEIYKGDLVWFFASKSKRLTRDYFIVNDEDLLCYHLNGGELIDVEEEWA